MGKKVKPRRMEPTEREHALRVLVLKNIRGGMATMLSVPRNAQAKTIGWLVRNGYVKRGKKLGLTDAGQSYLEARAEAEHYCMPEPKLSESMSNLLRKDKRDMTALDRELARIEAKKEKGRKAKKQRGKLVLHANHFTIIDNLRAGRHPSHGFISTKYAAAYRQELLEQGYLAKVGEQYALTAKGRNADDGVSRANAGRSAGTRSSTFDRDLERLRSERKRRSISYKKADKDVLTGIYPARFRLVDLDTGAVYLPPYKNLEITRLDRSSGLDVIQAVLKS